MKCDTQLYESAPVPTCRMLSFVEPLTLGHLSAQMGWYMSVGLYICMWATLLLCVFIWLIFLYVSVYVVCVCLCMYGHMHVLSPTRQVYVCVCGPECLLKWAGTCQWVYICELLSFFMYLCGSYFSMCLYMLWLIFLYGSLYVSYSPSLCISVARISLCCMRVLLYAWAHAYVGPYMSNTRLWSVSMHVHTYEPMHIYIL